jgi:hypothetical protein
MPSHSFSAISLLKPYSVPYSTATAALSRGTCSAGLLGGAAACGAAALPLVLIQVEKTQGSGSLATGRTRKKLSNWVEIRSSAGAWGATGWRRK